MKIEIPFNEWSRDKLLRGLKIATTRTKPYGRINDTFFVDFGYRFGEKEYKILSIFSTNLTKVASNMWKMEGANSPEDFIDVWIDIHKRAGWTPDKLVWVHIFEEL